MKSSNDTEKSVPYHELPTFDHPLLDTGQPTKSCAFSQNEPTFDDNITEAGQEGDSCGIGTWRPQWMQLFATPLFFMINMAVVGIIQGMTSSLFFSSISTFERRYAFDSKISAIILVSDNVAEMILNPIVGYFGIRFNRARCIAIGEMILSASCFLTALPFLIYGSTSHLQEVVDDDSVEFLLPLPFPSIKQNNFQMCPITDRSHLDCSSGQGATLWPAVCFLVIGSFARGLGYTCYFVIGFPYLDDNLKKKQTPMYLSIMQSVRLIGPALGYMLSAFCLSLYENPFVDPGFGQHDARFIGAWWLSFCITGSLLFICALPMFLFPAQFKDASVNSEDIQRQIDEKGGSLGALKHLLTNPLVMLGIGGNIFRWIGMGGFIMFTHKYIESQYRQSSSAASFITGTASYFPVAAGILIGGSLLAYLKPRPRLVFILVFLVEGVSLLTIGSGLFLGCEPAHMSGHFDESGHFSPMTPCNDRCQCSTRGFTPICGPDGRTTFFSPCHAGCSSYNSHSLAFGDCACFHGTASKGYCPSDVSKCTNMVPYVSIIGTGHFISSMARTANTLIGLRSVDPIYKSFSLGLSSTLMDIFSFIPYPLLFGYIADKACLVWEFKCGKTGNCWLYDNDRFRNYLHGTALAFLLIGSFFDFATIFYSGRVRNFYENDEEEEGEMKSKSKSSVKRNDSTDF